MVKGLKAYFRRYHYHKVKSYDPSKRIDISRTESLTTLDIRKTKKTTLRGMASKNHRFDLDSTRLLKKLNAFGATMSNVLNQIHQL